jgi:ABC-type bacteriocin/lantibiotic exporter with double-glycine peptidase domain
MLNVPIYLQQQETTCFAASARMDLAYFRIFKTEEKIIKEMRCNPSAGAYITELADYFNKLRLGTFCFLEFASAQDAMSMLEEQLQREIPVIVLLDPDCGKYPYKLQIAGQKGVQPEFHMAVVVDANPQNITLNDPASGRISMNYTSFANELYNDCLKGQMCGIE